MGICDVTLCIGVCLSARSAWWEGRRHWGSAGAREVLTGFKEGILLHEVEQIAQELCSLHPWGFLRSDWTFPE